MVLQEKSEIPNKFEITSTWLDKMNQNVENFKPYDGNEITDEYVKNDAITFETAGSKLLPEYERKIFEDYNNDEANPNNAEKDTAGQECKPDANDEIVEQIEKGEATPDDAENGILQYEYLAAEPNDALSAKEERGKSHKVLKHMTSVIGRQRRTPYGNSLNRFPFVRSQFPNTLFACWNASSIKILFQTLCFVAGFCSYLSGTDGESISPQDTFAAIGSTVRLQCSSSLKKPVYWEWTPVQSKTGHYLYIGNGGMIDKADDRITVDIDKDTGRYDLIINGVQIKHAGTYNCIENSGLGKSKSAELIILDLSQWNCSMDMPSEGFMSENVFNIPEDIMLASCSLHFSGQKDPTIRWSLSKNVSYKNATTFSKSGFTITTSFSIRPTKELDKSVLLAHIESPGDSVLTADGHIWKSQILTVNYAQLAGGQQKSCLEAAKNTQCNPTCSFAYNTTDCVMTYPYGNRNYEFPLAIGDDAYSVQAECKWLLFLLLSVLLFIASLCVLAASFLYIRFKGRGNGFKAASEGIRELHILRRNSPYGF